MSPNYSATRAARQNESEQRHGASLIALWLPYIALAATCLMVGGATLTGTPPMASMFTAIGRTPPMVNVFNATGLGLWLYYVTGVTEVTAAIALLLPSVALYGALLLIPTMIVAIADNVFILHASPVAPVVLLIGATGVALARRQQFLGLIRDRGQMSKHQQPSRRAA